MEVGISAAQGRARIPPRRLTLGIQGVALGLGLPVPARAGSSPNPGPKRPSPHPSNIQQGGSQVFSPHPEMPLRELREQRLHWGATPLPPPSISQLMSFWQLVPVATGE